MHMEPVILVLLTFCSGLTFLPLGAAHGENGTLTIAFAAISDSTIRRAPYKYGNMGSAVVMALEEVNANPYILPNHTLKYILTPTDCNRKIALDTVVHYRYKVDAYIGPACYSAAASAALLASYWNIPILALASAGILADKGLYDTLTRAVSPLDTFALVINNVIQQFGWHRIGLLKNRGSSYLTQLEIPLLEEFSKVNNSITHVGPFLYNRDFERTHTMHYKAALLEVAAKSKVIVVLSTNVEYPPALLAAYDMGLFRTNEYVFILVDITETFEALTFQWLWTGDPVKDKKLDVAYKSCVHITKIPYFLDDSYKVFLDEVLIRLRDPPFLSNLSSTSQLNSVTPYLYDAVTLYARTADSMLRQGLDPTDGRAFTQHAKTVQFYGKTGSVSINANGDRSNDFAVYDYQNGTFMQVARYDGYTHEYITLKEIKWGPNDEPNPPPDTPPCGFEGELCIQEASVDNTTLIIGGVLGGLLLAVLGTAYYVYRNLRFEAELKAANWKIAYSELNFVKQAFRSGISLASAATGATGGMGKSGNIATYKHDMMYVKRIAREQVDWKKRSILLELTFARDFRHENVNQFVGACVEPGNILLVLRLCAKGGLDDLLQNTDIQLDLSFKVSIAMDIINGLKYIHKSELGCHGNLKSSNCLVDSRWQVKLSGWGLKEFTRPDNPSKDDNQGYQGLLWTAPEHLRDQKPGSAKGDIYSFAIILQEMALRSGPFSECDSMIPEEIITLVRDARGDPFRPPLPDKSIEPLTEQLMKKCWAENPLDRPDLNTITKDLKEINSGKSINIMDNMVLMLEKYASNLEDIVNERTTQLLEEKKKTDRLLHQMLPESVADQLKLGQTVNPEAFDQVTIFFSDIVGFTALSSESTPIQVVNLLNDLYSLFDGILSEYDVYKVETIGDAYMVVSGLPIRNENRHAGEIGTVSLHLLSSVLSFTIRHLPDRKLKLRVGIHSGPCVSGVVGLRMPRYCLFGDTVNTASRMESNGIALRIHVSEQTKTWLDALGGYNIVERGQVEMKGKGIQTTYWLQGKHNFHRPLPNWENID